MEDCTDIFLVSPEFCLSRCWWKKVCLIKDSSEKYRRPSSHPHLELIIKWEVFTGCLGKCLSRGHLLFLLTASWVLASKGEYLSFLLR